MKGDSHVGKKLAVLSISLLLAACTKPSIDTSSDEAMKASVAKVRESLPESKRAEFDQALQVLAFNQLDFASLFKDGMTGTSTTLDNVKSTLNGRTGEQVIDEAGKIVAERRTKEREQALAEIEELQTKKASSEVAKAQLTKFEVTRSKFYKRQRDFLGNQPVIELTVRNGTSSAVSRAYFLGTLASPGRSVPWIKDTFNYEISGGLEPGEEARWTLAPNMFSDWGKVNAPADAVFTAEVERLDGADSKALYSTQDFTEEDEERLTKLTREFGPSK